jgi:4-diphosphocytidyl-2-C-methyl-D-erythritol kinase
LRALAPAKVNLSLFLGPTREDGRHRLVTLFQSLSLADVLELEVIAEGAEDRVVCPGVEGENLATRALAALRARGWAGPAVNLDIEKRIPVAAGMAGGSADAAAALRLAMAVAPGRAEEVDAIAAALGADVPSQLMPGVAVGTGAGELVEQFEPLASHAYVVLPSPFELSTADVFREADRLALQRPPDELDALYGALVGAVAPGGRWIPQDLLVNDLQPAALSLCPSIADALEAVLGVGAQHALVSGSGPTVVGIWWGSEAAERASEGASLLADRWRGAVAAHPVSAEYALPSLI